MLVFVNIVSNISLLICAVQLFLFLPKTLSSLNTSFIFLQFLQRDWISFATNLYKSLLSQKDTNSCKTSPLYLFVHFNNSIIILWNQRMFLSVRFNRFLSSVAVFSCRDVSREQLRVKVIVLVEALGICAWTRRLGGFANLTGCCYRRKFHRN